MGSLAENLEPPFYAAILNDNNLGLEDETHIGPTDEMVSLAPRQPGFMGLETSRDDKGHWVAISYWRDKSDIEAWRSKGDGTSPRGRPGRVGRDARPLRSSTGLREGDP